MEWQRDPKTGEWVVVDPMTQGMTGQESDPTPRDAMPNSSVYTGRRTPPGAPTPDDPLLSGGSDYQNSDPSAYAAWARGVEARGNEVRETAVGCFEVDSGGRIVSTAPPKGY